MKQPKMKYSETRTRQQIVTFKGLQYGKTTTDGDIAECYNLSTRDYPAISQREGRTVLGEYTSPSAIYYADKLCVVDGENVIYDGETVGTVEPGVKQIAIVNNKLVIFPDKVYYDIEKDYFGTMGAIAQTEASHVVTFTTNTIETGELNLTENKSFEDQFAAGQAVEISGCSIEENNITAIIRSVKDNTLTFDDDIFVAGESTTGIKIERKIPDLSYICESNNRLWGVEQKTVWASALGDPLTFYNYDGLSTDSYAVTTSADADFTGCCSYSSNVLFFTEQMLYKMLGSEPSEYRMYSYTVPGLQTGSHKSLVTINEVLFYKGVDGIYSYTGSVPQIISENFGTLSFEKACAGTDGQNYYISMQNKDTQQWGLFVFDTLRNLWIKEDESHAIDFARIEGDLCFISNNNIYKTGQSENDIEWYAVLAPFDWVVPERKTYTRLYVQAELEKGARMTLEYREDGGKWIKAFSHHAERRKNFAIPVYPGYCDTLQIKLHGIGKCLVRQVTREFVIGGER